MVTEVGCCNWIGVKLLYTLAVVNDRCNSLRILLPMGLLTDERLCLVTCMKSTELNSLNNN